MVAERGQIESIQRGHRILWLYCYRCHRERPFSQVDAWRSAQVRVVRIIQGRTVVLPSKCPTPNIPDDVRKIRAACMYCLHGAMYVTTVERLRATQYGADDLCGCGLPLDHEGPHLDPPYERRKRCHAKRGQ